MPTARKHQISLQETPYYHCVSRCVRRAYLCGEDTLTGKSFEHRRQWVEDRLLLLSTIFAIDVCAFAIMSNHSHVVLHVDLPKSRSWTDKEVCLRWHKLHKGTLLTHKFIASSTNSLSQSEMDTVRSTLSIYRKRLSDISWFMRELNEPIARRANHEDDCTGHFWEGRFKSQALLDEHALAACMVYVDLNPIRANIASTPETSKHTSIWHRTRAFGKGEQPATLMPLGSHYDRAPHNKLAFDLQDYIRLVDFSGRCLHPEKRGSIRYFESPILQRLGLDENSWHLLFTRFEVYFRLAAGQPSTLKNYRRRLRKSYS